MNDMIEKLKDKDYVRAFGLMSPEERECLKKVGKENCLCFHGGQWGDPYRSNACFNYQFTYAIKPDYQSAPEFVDLEIEIHMQQDHTSWLGVHMTEQSEFLPHPFTHLHCLSSLPEFRCFWEENEDNSGYILNKAFWMAGLVSIKRDEGHKVFARFQNIHEEKL